MAKYELTKNIEAKKLNKRTRVPIGGPPQTLPYGAIIEDLSEERHVVKFSYLGEPYQGSREEVNAAITPIGSHDAAAAAPKIPQTASPAFAAAESAPQAAPVRNSGPVLIWEPVESNQRPDVLRARVHGGWLVSAGNAGLTFVPDSEHRWVVE